MQLSAPKEKTTSGHSAHGEDAEHEHEHEHEQDCDQDCDHGIYIRWYLIKRCARKEQSLLFDLYKAFD